MSALERIVVIARNTLLEAMRQRVLHVLLVFGLVVIGGANFLSQFAFDQEFKFVKDLGLGVMALIGVIMAIVAVAQLLPAELESRTVFTILSKPVRRWEFLAGKFAGVAVLLAVSVALMGVMFGGVLLLKEQRALAELRAQAAGAGAGGLAPEGREEFARAEAKIRGEARDPRLVQAVALVYGKLLVTASMALAVSTVATSMMFTVVVAAMLHLIGHLQATAREAWLAPGSEAGLGAKVFLAVVASLVPDMNAFNLVDDIVAGSAVAWSHTAHVLGYGLGYAGVAVLVACALFESREL